MKSTNAVIAALASTAIAQPHAHQHAHHHPARMEHEHLHHKRVLETETVVEWVTETVIEMIEGTTTEWVTEGATAAPTTLSTVIATTTSEAGQFFETSKSEVTSATTTPVAVAQPVEQTTSSTSVEVPETTTSSSAYVAQAEPTPSTTSTEAPVVVEPTSTTTSQTTTAAAAAAATTTAASSSSGSTVSGTDFSGKLTWIGETTGAYSACGVLYEADSMFVAVNPSVLDCGPDGQGTPMSITANGKTINAIAIDKCMGCTTDHIDVASAVWTALGYTFDDGGMHDNAGLSWVLSSTK